MASFAFGGNTGTTYEDLKRRRALAAQLARSAVSGSPSNIGEGLTAIGKALAYRTLNKKNDALEAQLGPQEGATGTPSVSRADLVRLLIGGDGDSALMGGAGSDTLSDVRPRVEREMAFQGHTPGTDQYYADRGGRILGEVGDDTLANTPLPGMMDTLGMGGNVPPAVSQQYDALDADQRFEMLNRLNADPMLPIEGALPPPQGADDPRGMFFEEDAMLQGGGGQDMMYGQQANDNLPYGDEKLTGDQSKAIAYYRRAYGANQALSDPKLGQALTQYTDSFAKNFGGVGRLFQDADFQVADRAASEFLAAILRKDTGAAITNEEFRLYGPMYLPQPGDKPELLEAKRKAREEALIAIEMGLGSAAPLAAMVRQELAPKETGATHRFNPQTGKIEAIQ